MTLSELKDLYYENGELTRIVLEGFLPEEDIAVLMEILWNMKRR